MDRAGFDTTVVRETIEQREPIKALDLNYQLFSQGIDPHDALVIQDLLEEQGRIEYNTETQCFSTAYESESRSDNRSNLSWADCRRATVSSAK